MDEEWPSGVEWEKEHKFQLNLKNIYERTRSIFGDVELVDSVDEKGQDVYRYTYSDAWDRICKGANLLEKLGIEQQEHVATFAWNNHRHFELFWSIPCYGAVMLGVNCRLFKDNIEYVINQAEPRIMFIDPANIPTMEKIKDRVNIEKYIVLDEEKNIPETSLEPIESYELLLDETSEKYDFPDVDENKYATMFYSTGTTGKPKGVRYTHRMLWTHSMKYLTPESAWIRQDDTTMLFAPFFTVNAWGNPYAATMAGAKQVFNGTGFDPERAINLIKNEEVTTTFGVPTVDRQIINLAKEENRTEDLETLRFMHCGGGVPDPALIRDINNLGIEVWHMYGITECSPNIVTSFIRSELKDATESSDEEYVRIKSKQGLIEPGILFKVVGEEGNEIPHDGEAMGELCVKSPWVVTGYYKDPEKTKENFDEDGYFHTGDIVTIDELGYIKIKDRKKSLIKSGGEWISGITLEDAISECSGVKENAVVPTYHPEWDERPLAVVVKEEGKELTEEDVISYLESRKDIADWWVPDGVVFVDELPLTSVGKKDKKVMKEEYWNYFHEE